MSDLIRRQDAINAMYQLEAEDIETYGCSIPEGFNAKPAVEALEALPSAEPERKWIPVTKALPEICQKDVRGNVTFSKRVWSCKKCGDDFFWQSTDQYTTNNGGGWLSEVPHDDPNDCCKVVAWMPLPEPWRGEE